MTTRVLTPNATNPLTNLVDPVIGWQLTSTTKDDVMEGIDYIATLGYEDDLSDPDQSVSPPIWKLIIIKNGFNPVVVKDE